MSNHLSIILVVIATIINSIVFGYVASNSKNNKINQSYLVFITFIILYTIFDCIIIQAFELQASKDIIVKIQALLWMPLSIIFLNFIYLLLKKPKDELFNIMTAGVIGAVFISLFSDQVILGYKNYNFGTMANTGPWFLPLTFIVILPPAYYAIYLIGKEGRIFNYSKNTAQQEQLKILFFGSILCLIIAITTNIFFDEVFGYKGELHLASLSLSIQSIFLLPALIKYNFLNKPIEKLGDELYAQSSDAVLIINQHGVIINLNKSARTLFKLEGNVINCIAKTLFIAPENMSQSNKNYETKTKTGQNISLTQTNITKGKLSLGKILVIRDISPLKKAEKKLLQTTKELITAQNVAGLGSFIYNVKNNHITWSDKLYDLYGLDKNSFNPTKENFLNKVVHPESQAFTKKKVNDALNNKVEELDYIHKILMPTGQEKWMHAIIKIMYDKKSEPILMNGTAQDISELYNNRLDLEESELRLKKAQEIAQLGRWEENHLTGEIYWSPILRGMFGLSEKKSIKQNLFWEMLHPADINWMQNIWEKAETEKKPYSGTFRIKLKNGKVKHLLEHAEFIQDAKGNLLKTFGTVVDMTKLHQYQEKLRQLSSHIQEVQEKERGRIAREIHDALGQRLTSINMDISFLKYKQEKDATLEVKERLRALSSLVEETIQITRKISQELRPSILDDIGLISAIDWLKEQYKHRTNIQFTIDMPTKEMEINNDYATAIFRITQEALTNIIKHANANNVLIQIKQKNSEIQLIINDDGNGLKKKDKPIKGETYGVFGMKERASILGGKLLIGNNSEKGTTVHLTLPYTQGQHAKT